MKLLKKVKYLVFVLLLFLLIGCGNENKTKYKVEFILNDDTYVIKEVEENNKVENVEIDPIQYDFGGWTLNGVAFDFNTPIISDIKLEGYAEDKEYTIIFKNEDGTQLRKNTYDPYETIQAPSNPTKKSDSDYDYTFAGWDKEFDKAVSDMVIVATYSKTDKLYEAIIYDGDGKELETLKVTRGTKVSLPTVTKENDKLYTYEFEYWMLQDGTKYDTEKGIQNDTRLYPRFKQTPVKFDCTGKVVSIVGDSVSTFYASGSPYNSMYNVENSYYYPLYSRGWGEKSVTSVNQTWWMKLINKLGAKLGVNNSWSGSSAYNNGSTQNNAAMNDNRLNTLADNGEPNIVLVLIGGNDNVNGHSEAQFTLAYDTIISKIKKKYPNAYVFSINQGYSAYNGYYYTEDRRQMINNVIDKVSNKYQCPVIDINSVQTVDTYEAILGDRLHPNSYGMEVWANKCYEVITNYFNQANN